MCEKFVILKTPDITSTMKIPMKIQPCIINLKLDKASLSVSVLFLSGKPRIESSLFYYEVHVKVKNSALFQIQLQPQQVIVLIMKFYVIHDQSLKKSLGTSSFTQ